MVFTPKFVVGVKGKAALPEPQAVPVFERSPTELNVAQPAVPPAEETTSALVDAVPETVRPVVEAYGNCDAATVEDAKKTPWVRIEVVVAAVFVANDVPRVKGKAKF